MRYSAAVREGSELCFSCHTHLQDLLYYRHDQQDDTSLVWEIELPGVLGVLVGLNGLGVTLVQQNWQKELVLCWVEEYEELVRFEYLRVSGGGI